MPKQKTHKGTKKRFRVSANGKIKHRSAGTSHLAAAQRPEADPQAPRHRDARHGMGKAIKRPGWKQLLTVGQAFSRLRVQD